MPGQNKKVSYLVEKLNVASGDMFYLVASGQSYKVTADAISRYLNDSFYLGCDTDPLAIDSDGNQYGRYNYTTCNYYFSGYNNVVRSEKNTFIIANSGIESNLENVTNYNHSSLGASLTLESLNEYTGNFTSILSRGTGDAIRAGIFFIHEGSGFENGSTVIAVRESGNSSLTNALNVKDNLKIGANIDTPLYRFHLEGVDNIDNELKLTTKSSDTDSIIELLSTDTSSGMGLHYDSSTNQGYIYNIGRSTQNDGIHIIVSGRPSIANDITGHEIMTLRNNKVGINQPNPSFNLHVSGDTWLSHYGTGTSIQTISYNDANLGAKLLFENLAAQSNTFNSILAKGTGNSIRSAIHFINKTSNENDGELSFAVRKSGGASVVEAMRINHRGYIGLGISQPSGRLHIQNNEADDNIVYLSTSSLGYHPIIEFNGPALPGVGYRLRYDPDLENMYFYNRSSTARNVHFFNGGGPIGVIEGATGSPQLTIHGNRKVGINMPNEDYSPNKELHISGELMVSGNATGYTSYIHMFSPNGTQYKLSVGNGGTLGIEAV